MQWPFPGWFPVAVFHHDHYLDVCQIYRNHRSVAQIAVGEVVLDECLRTDELEHVCMCWRITMNSVFGLPGSQTVSSSL